MAFLGATYPGRGSQGMGYPRKSGYIDTSTWKFVKSPHGSYSAPPAPKTLPRKVSFRGAAKGIQLGQHIRDEIRRKQIIRMLVQADMAPELVHKLARILHCDDPKLLVALPPINSEPIRDENHEEDLHDLQQFNEEEEEDSCQSDYEFTSEQLEASSLFFEALDDFLFRTDTMSQENLNEMTRGLMSGLRSWLSFGSSMAPSGGSFEAENKMASFLSSTQASVEIRKSGANIQTLKTDDRLTQKAEEQASKIAGEFCAWLRNLPAGTSDTVNTIPEEHVRALFDIGQAVNPGKSKLAQGLMSWAKFGQIAAPKEALANITTQQVSKQKFRKKLDHRKQTRQHNQRSGADKLRNPGAHRSSSEWPTSSTHGHSKHDEATRQKLRVQYAGHVWHLHPTQWNERLKRALHEERFQSTVEAVLASTWPAQQRPEISSMERSSVGEILSSSNNSGEAGSMGPGAGQDRATNLRRMKPRVKPHSSLGQPQMGPGSSVHQRINVGQTLRSSEDTIGMNSGDEERLDQLTSSVAFAEFLARRPNYQPPPFLTDILPLVNSKIKDN